MQRRPTLTEGKLMIMRCLDYMEPLDEDQLTEFFAELNLLTFFEIKEALSELLESSLIAVTRSLTDKTAYILTAEGRFTYNEFVRSLPWAIRDMIDGALQDWKKVFRRREQVRAQITKADDGEWCAIMSIYESERPSMELKLRFSDREQAQKAVDGFIKNAEKLFASIWNILDI